MSVNETLSKKVYRTLKTIDGSGNKTWNKLAFWTTADQVEMDNGDNAQDVLESIMMRNTTVYVSTTGSDITGTGTSANPYATPSRALSDIPKNLNGHDAIINIASGSYTNNVGFDGFHGGRVYVNINGSVIINGYITSNDCSGMLQFQTLSSGDLTINNTPNYSNGAIYLSSSFMLQVITISLVINSTTYGIITRGSSGFYSNSSVTINNANVSISSGSCCAMSFASTLTGSGNNIGLQPISGSISYDQALFTLSATTPTQKIDGGIITNELALASSVGAKVVISATAPSDTSVVWVY